MLLLHYMFDRAERDPSLFRSLPLRQKMYVGALVLAAASMPTIGIQVAIDQGNRPEEPDVEWDNPVTWVATPLSNYIESVAGRDLPATHVELP